MSGPSTYDTSIFQVSKSTYAFCYLHALDRAFKVNFNCFFMLFRSFVQICFFYEIPHNFVIITIVNKRNKKDLKFLHKWYLP